MNGNEEKALENAKLFQDVFGAGNYFLEIQDRVDERGQQLVSDTVALSKKSGIPIVVTNDVHYLSKDDARAQQVLIAIGEGRTVGEHREADSAIRYLRSAEEMWDIFGAELPESLSNTVRIAEMCDLDIPQGDDVRQLPNYPIPVSSGDISVDDYFERVLWEGFEDRKKTEWGPMLELGTLKHSLDEYEERLRIEIATIKRMGFPGYFLDRLGFYCLCEGKEYSGRAGTRFRRRFACRLIVCVLQTLIRSNMICSLSDF